MHRFQFTALLLIIASESTFLYSSECEEKVECADTTSKPSSITPGEVVRYYLANRTKIGKYSTREDIAYAYGQACEVLCLMERALHKDDISKRGLIITAAANSSLKKPNIAGPHEVIFSKAEREKMVKIYRAMEFLTQKSIKEFQEKEINTKSS